MPEGQRHLTHPGRCRIHATGKSGLSDGAIARQLGRDRTTVWREVRRNPGERACRHAQAQRRSEARRRAAPSVPGKMTPERWRMVEERLAEGWSPERVSGRLRKEGHPVAGRQWTCRHVHADRRAGGGLWRHLRRRPGRPNRRGGAHAGRGHIPGRVDIPERPAPGEAKARVGDREADTNQRRGHRRGRGVAGGQGVEIHAPAACRQEDRGRGRRGHDAHAGLPSRPHGHGRQRQGVRRPRAGGRGAGRGVPVRAPLPLLGTGPDRAHQRPRARIPAQGHGPAQGDGRRGQGRPGPHGRASAQGPGLPDAGGGVPAGAASLRKAPDGSPSTRRGPSPEWHRGPLNQNDGTKFANRNKSAGRCMGSRHRP